MKRTAIIVIVLLSVAAAFLVFPHVSAQVDTPACDPASLIADLSQIKTANGKTDDLQQLQKIDAAIQAMLITCYGTPTPVGTSTLAPTLSRTDIAGTRAANQTATTSAYLATRTQQAANVQATRAQYSANATATADARYATATQRAADRAATNAVYRITLTYIGPIQPTSAQAQAQPKQDQSGNSAAPQPTQAPAAQPGNGATALCKDGTYSYAASHQGACSHHGGVAVFYK